MSVFITSLENGQIRDVDEMAIFRFVINYSHINNPEFIEAFQWASELHEILDSRDFLEFLAWWMSRNDFRNNCFKNSSFGVVQQFLGVLSEDESNYVNERSASWYGGVSLRLFLRHVTERFPPRLRSHTAPRFSQ